METIVERSGALDVHKDEVNACVRVPDGAARREVVAVFSTTTRGLLKLDQWLDSYGVTQVAMEATGVCWKPVWAVLEGSFDCLLVNARHVKQVPGRKTDVSDAAWLCRLLEAGLLQRSFVPPPPIRTLRNLTRYRKTQIAERQREANRLHKILEDAGIKLGSVASDILGKSGRLILAALVAGQTNPAPLADLAKGRLRSKQAALEEALEGRFSDEHRVIVGAILAHLDFLDQQIDALTGAIDEQIRPFEGQVEALLTIPGVGRRTAEVVIAEIGADMTRFPTAGHLAAWAGICPANNISAGKPRRGPSRKGSKWLGMALTESALAASRTRGTYLNAQYQRLRPRRGHQRAIGALKHSILTAIWHMLQTGETYNDPGPDWFAQRDPARRTRQLIRQLEALGHHVTLESAA